MSKLSNKIYLQGDPVDHHQVSSTEEDAICFWTVSIFLTSFVAKYWSICAGKCSISDVEGNFPINEEYLAEGWLTYQVDMDFLLGQKIHLLLYLSINDKFKLTVVFVVTTFDYLQTTKFYYTEYFHYVQIYIL